MTTRGLPVGGRGTWQKRGVTSAVTCMTRLIPLPHKFVFNDLIGTFVECHFHDDLLLTCAACSAINGVHSVYLIKYDVT